MQSSFTIYSTACDKCNTLVTFVLAAFDDFGGLNCKCEHPITIGKIKRFRIKDPFVSLAAFRGVKSE